MSVTRYSCVCLSWFKCNICLRGVKMIFVLSMLTFFWYNILVQHRVRLGKYKRDPDSIAREGENLQAIWSPDTKLIAVIVSMNWQTSALFDFDSNVE